MSDLSEKKIQQIISQYKYHIDYNKNKYHEVSKHDPTYMENNRQRARRHYEKKENKDKKKKYYNDNKELSNYKSSYYYYKQRGRLEEFKENHKNKYDFLIKSGFVVSDEA
jgi:hypothetical protein